MERNSDKRLTQLLFCDLSTPKGAGEFSVYTDIRQKLIERGIPESEIKFIHEADTETKKQELLQKGTPWRSANPDGQYTENGCGDKCAEQDHCFPRP